MKNIEKTVDENGKVTIKTIETRRFEEKRIDLPFGMGFTRTVEVKEKPETEEEQQADEKAKKKGFMKKLGIGLIIGGALGLGGKALLDRNNGQDEDPDDAEDEEEYDDDEYDDDEDSDEEDE